MVRLPVPAHRTVPMSNHTIRPELREWILATARSGHSLGELLLNFLLTLLGDLVFASTYLGEPLDLVENGVAQVPQPRPQIDDRQMVAAEPGRPFTLAPRHFKILLAEVIDDRAAQGIGTTGVERADRSRVVVRVGAKDRFIAVQLGQGVGGLRASRHQSAVELGDLLVADRFSAGRDNVVLGLEGADGALGGECLLPEIAQPVLQPGCGAAVGLEFRIPLIGYVSIGDRIGDLRGTGWVTRVEVRLDDIAETHATDREPILECRDHAFGRLALRIGSRILGWGRDP